MDIPTVNPGGPEERPLQITPAPTAPPSAFSGQVGHAIEAAGQELGRIAADERERVATGVAMEAETAYQRHADELNAKFRSIVGPDALIKSEEFKQEVYASREQFVNSLASRHSRRLFEANSQRIARFAEAGIDAHTAQQRQQIAHQQLTDYSQTTLQSVAADATNGVPPAMLGVRIKSAYQHYRDWAEMHGEADPQEFALRETANVAGAAIGGLARVSWNGAKSMLGEYGQYLTPEKRAAITDQIAHGETDDAAAQLTSAAPRINGARYASAPIDKVRLDVQVAEYQKAHPDLVDRDNRPLLADAVDKKWREHEVAADQYGKGVLSRLVRGDVDTAMTGVFKIPYRQFADDVEYLRRVDPQGLERLMSRERADQAAAGKGVDSDARKSSVSAYNRFEDAVRATDQTIVDKYTRRDLDSMLLKSYPEMLPAERDRAEKYLKGWQSGGEHDPSKGLKRDVHTLVGEMSKLAYQGDSKRAYQARVEIGHSAEEAVERGTIKSRADAEKFVRSQFAKVRVPGTFFGFPITNDSTEWEQHLRYPQADE